MERITLLKNCIGPLLQWFGGNKRSLPFRENPTAYGVWVSEIMLQQTRMEAVLPYYRRFMEELPTVADLAACDSDRLHKLWQGLGYYSRVRNLQKAAKTVMDVYGGEIPHTRVELLQLPGIGDYTASAVASIVFHEPVPAVDGNVLRVFSRLTEYEEDVLKQSSRAEIRNALLEVIPHDRAGDFNQAMMELGATVCLPAGAPLCSACPLRNLCKANASGKAQVFPVKGKKKERKKQNLAVFILKMGDRYAIHKRENSGLLASLWEFPNSVAGLGSKQAEQALKKMGANFVGFRQIGRSRHLFTHIEWEMRWYEAELDEIVADFVFVTKEELKQIYSVPSAFSFGVRYILLP